MRVVALKTYTLSIVAIALSSGVTFLFGARFRDKIYSETQQKKLSSPKIPEYIRRASDSKLAYTSKNKTAATNSTRSVREMNTRTRLRALFVML